MRRACLGVMVLLACHSACFAGLTQRQLQDAKLDPLPGTPLPLAAVLLGAEGGKAITLGQALAGKPAVLLLVDYDCRFICGSLLAVAAAGLSETGLVPGSDFQLIVIGIGQRRGTSTAQTMKAEKLAPYPALADAAVFLAGDTMSIGKITDALGYRAVYDPEIDQFAHPAGAVVLTPDGRVSRVISGLALDGESLRGALAEAREGNVQAHASGIWLLCYRFLPLQGPYSFAIRLTLMIAGVLTLIGLAAFAGLLSRRAKARRLT
jgi:protein SCO1